MRLTGFRTFCFLALCFFHEATLSQTIHGAGSSAAKPLYQKWADAYLEKHAVSIDYQAIGSSAGIKKIKEKTTDFGASDVALSANELQQFQLIQFPSAISGVVPIVNIQGIKSGDIKLTGEVLAAIFSRTIQEWNDPAIAAINPNLHLPKNTINVVARLDGSGTTYNFADYLSRVSPVWKNKFGVDFLIKWPTDVRLAKGSSGIVDTVKKTPNSISYVDYNYVMQDHLNYVQLQNREGVFISPNPTRFESALNHSEWKTQSNFSAMLTDQMGANSWPITMGTFIIMPKIAVNPSQTIAVLKFFSWGFIEGDHHINSLDFVRLPDPIQAKIFKQMTTITNPKGERLMWSPLD